MKTSLMNKWDKIKLGDIASLDYGYGASAKAEEVGPKFLRITDITSDLIDWDSVPYCEIKEKDIQKYKLEKGDIVIARTGATAGYAKIIRNPNNSVFAGYLIRARVDRNVVDPRFLGPIIESNLFKQFVERNKGGAAQPHANVPVIREFYFPSPPLPTQQRIASILSAYDDLIENNARRIKILEEQAKLIYKERFVKFKFPGWEKVKMVDSGTEFGEIPEGWEVKKLFDIADAQYGFPFKSNQFNEIGVGKPAIRIRDLKNSSTKTYTDERVDDKYMVKNGDILVGMDGDFSVCKRAGGEALLVQRTVCFRPKLENLSFYFLFHLLELQIKYFNGVIVGTTVAHLSDRDLRSIDVILPKKDLLLESKKILDVMYDMEIKLKVENKNLKETRDMLIPKLVSGEVEV